MPSKVLKGASFKSFVEPPVWYDVCNAVKALTGLPIKKIVNSYYADSECKMLCQVL
jgi:hypothetical protein